MDSPSTIALSILCAWALLYLPGQALLRSGSVSLPTAFGRVVGSVVVTTLVGTALAAAETFSLSHLLAGNAAAAVVLLLLRRQLAPAPGGPHPARDFLGPALVAAALGVYWPAYPVFLAGSDATAYVGSSVSLARHGSLAREDLLGPAIPPDVREVIFDSMSQVFLKSGPPYRRVPGAMLVEERGDRKAWPCFFPVPSVWGAISTLRTGTLDERAAPDFAPFFAALALWAFWHLARQWLGSMWGLAAAVLLGVSGPWYMAAHMPMSEMIAAFFVLAGLAFTAAATASGRRGDALLAGAALGAAIFTRVEVAMLLVLAFALLPSLDRGREDGTPPVPRVFFVALVAIGSLAIVQALLLPGTYVSPLLDHLKNVRVNFHLRFGHPAPALVAAAVAAALGVFAALVRAFGLSATIRWGAILAALAGHAAASRFLYERTPMWLSFYVGWSGLTLFAAGAFFAWRRRALLPAGPFVVALTAVVCAILFYNPHVYPALPWGSRRYVPVLLPLVVLLATYAISTTAARSRVAAALLVALLAWPVAGGVRATWGEPFVDGAWEQLQDISKAIPKPGIILVDRELSRLMIAPSLWLVLDRNNVTVPPIDAPLGVEILQKFAGRFHGKWPVYFVTRAAGGLRRPAFTSMVKVGQAVVNLRVIEPTYSRVPEYVLRDVVPIAVYRVSHSFDPKPGTVR